MLHLKYLQKNSIKKNINAKGKFIFKIMILFLIIVINSSLKISLNIL